MRTLDPDRILKKEKIRDACRGENLPEMDGYHRTIIPNRNKWHYDSNVCKSALEWCYENLGLADDWSNERKWFNFGPAFYFTDKSDQVMFTLMFSE